MLYIPNFDNLSDQPLLFALTLKKLGDEIEDQKKKELINHFNEVYYQDFKKNILDICSKKNITVEFPEEVLQKYSPFGYKTYIMSYYQKFLLTNPIYLKFRQDIENYLERFEKSLLYSSNTIREKYNKLEKIVLDKANAYEEKLNSTFELIDNINLEFQDFYLQFGINGNNVDENKKNFKIICNKNNISDEKMIDMLFEISNSVNMSIINLAGELKKFN